MEFRKTTLADIDYVMDIINHAKRYFKEKGIDQWQNGYPNPEAIKEDIDNGYGYVLLKNKAIVGTLAVSFDGEKTYNEIFEGSWISNEKYAVIHRIAIDNDYKGEGLASLIFKNVEELCLNNKVHSIKVDTHKENISMKRLLLKNDFKYCGIIYLEGKSERIAFEKKVIER